MLINYLHSGSVEVEGIGAILYIIELFSYWKYIHYLSLIFK